MKTLLLSAVLAGLLAACDSRPTAGKPEPAAGGAVLASDDFEKDGSAWEFATGRWERRRSGEAGVLAQAGPGTTYNVALLKDRSFADADVRVRFRPVSGQVDASGGIVVRARDANNYFVVRANALEGNFRLYKTVEGVRRQIASASVDAPALGTWHTLRVIVKGDRIQAALDGQMLIDQHDATFAEGRVGLWTKEDSVTEFDDFEVRAP